MRAIPAAEGLRARTAALLDVRDDEAFRAGHLAGSGHVPFETLEVRRAELPPRDAPLMVVAADAAAARAAAERLEAMGYADVAYLDAAPASIAGALDERGAAARLWRPAPFLEAVLASIPRGPAADLACGSGRDAVFMALHGFAPVEGWDHAPEALERARALAARHGVALRTVLANLEWGQPPLPEAAFALITVFRFLHRPLFPALARALAPGGTLVLETYRVGQERFGRPKSRRFLLEPDELRRAFPTLDVVHYEECDPEAGPVTARLIARRP